MTKGLPIWTIYDHPRDYPTHYVARCFVNDRPTGHLLKADTLEELRRHFQHAGLTCLTRSPEDDPKIIETWL